MSTRSRHASANGTLGAIVSVQGRMVGNPEVIAKVLVNGLHGQVKRCFIWTVTRLTGT